MSECVPRPLNKGGDLNRGLIELDVLQSNERYDCHWKCWPTNGGLEFRITAAHQAKTTPPLSKHLCPETAGQCYWICQNDKKRDAYVYGYSCVYSQLAAQMLVDGWPTAEITQAYLESLTLFLAVDSSHLISLVRTPCRFGAIKRVSTRVED